MTIERINEILLKLSKAPSRETNLELANALMQFIKVEGILPKPLMLQTQLIGTENFLAVNPITKQKQIFLLTEKDNKIVVKYAVVKKIRKETIHQIVDKETGIHSFQKTIPAFRLLLTTPPYYIHFFTTDKYDKLVIAIDNGNQKRLITLRNKLTQTQFNHTFKDWQNIATISKTDLVDKFWKSLDLKEVNKDFYKQVKEQFDGLLGIAKIQQPTADEQEVKQFAVRLIGRYIFCWFLKEKGIIHEKLLASETIENTDSFDKNILVPLFFNTLNTPLSERSPLSFGGLGGEAIPYLNGGLFDKHPDDILFEKLDLNDWLISFVKVLENFDFTVDESSSQYQQVAIDPEMLGRIFENLLASQNKETEKLANDRKAFGAFYTPREIVDYMVNESLKAHLMTSVLPKNNDTENTNSVHEPLVAYRGSLFHDFEPQQTMLNLSGKERAEKEEAEKKCERLKAKIEKLFVPDCTENPFEKNESQQIRNALSEVKILDPACGSGAFPMGVLLRLMELRQIVGHGHKNNYELKSEILSKNIYGVDIMPMAVEIARLRAWLSLVLEAEYKPTDRKNNFGIAALPNLDFKFVCANSLIDSGYDDFLSKIKFNLTLYRLDGEIQKLERIRDDYFDPKGDKTKKENLQKEFEQTKQYIKEQINVGTLKKNYTLDDFFNKVDDWNPFDDSHPSSFFSPAWMFGIRDGFDVVIGNPPYVPMESLSSELREVYKKKYRLFYRKYETSVLFIVEGLNKLNKNGVLSFIAPMTWQTGENYSSFRKYILKEKGIITILNLPFDIFEAAYVDTGVYLLSNTTSNFYSVFAFDKKEKKLDLSNIKFEKIDLDKITEPDYKLILDKKIGSINSHFKGEQFTTLGLITKSTQGLSGSRFIKSNDDIHGDNIFPFLQRGNVFNYQLKVDEFFLTDLSDKQNLKQFYEAEPKILIRRIINRQDRLSVSFCDERLVFKKDINPFIPVDNNYSAKFLLAILASTLISKLYIIGSSIATKDDFRQTTLSELRKLPIPIINQENQQPFITRVEEILSLKKQNQDTTALEKEIDVMVYKLYELTYEEVKIIEPEFSMTKEEYEQYKAP